nr:synaptobrevin, longin-like domain protein [Tanacetum cinerariifolium]
MVDFIKASSLRRNLMLKDKDGISSLPNTKLFENLTLIGYNISPNQKFTFQKGQFSHQWKYLIHTIMQCLSPKRIGFNEFSSNIATALVCLATNRTYNFSKMIFDGLVKNVNNKVSKFLMYQDQDMATIAKSSTLPHDSAPRVTSPAADEGNMQQIINELTAFCTSVQRQHSELLAKFQDQEVEINRLKERVKLLEDRDGVAVERSKDDAPINRRSLDEGEAVAERVSNDSEEMATVLTSIDAATVLAGGIDDVPTGSRSIPIASLPTDEVPTGSDVAPTASPVFTTATVVTPYRRRKGKEVMVESDTPKKQKVQEQIDAQSQQRKSWTKNQKRDYYMAMIRSNLGWKVKDFRGMTFEEVEAKFNSVWKQIEDFIPMGSKEEAERIKRKGLSLEQESAKKFKPLEEVTEEAKSPNEVPEEKIKEMMQLVPIEEVEDLNQLWRLVKETLSNRPPTSKKEMELWVELSRLYEPDDEDQLWTHTQNLMHALVEWKLYVSCGVHHVTAKYKEIFMLVEKDYPLKKGLALVMISYKLQVENYSMMENDLILKIYKISSALRQQGIEFPLDYALETATRILNTILTKKVYKTPYELWYGKVPNLSYLNIYGCEALVKHDMPDKLQQRSIKCIFVGDSSESLDFEVLIVGGISKLLAVGTTFTGSENLYCQWELSPGSGNALYILFPTVTDTFLISNNLPLREVSPLPFYVPAMKQLAIKWWDEYGFVIHPGLVGETYKSIRIDL